MEYRRLGRSALAVSELCLGTMNLGDRTPEQESFEILDRSTDAGINFIDTADHYGGAAGVGATEALLGRWIAADPARRDRIVLATKVHEPMSDDVNDRGLSARHIRMACEASLRRLGVEHIDLYQMHHIDRAAPIDEIWQAMDQLISSGKITYVGSSNFPGWAIARASERAIAERRFGLVSEQHLYNLLERRAELEVLPASRAYGVGFIPWSPLAGGLLAGSATGRGGRRASDAAQRAREHHADQLDRFQCLCADAGEPESIVALAWLLQRPGVSATIIGPRTVEQLESVLRVPDVRLDGDILARLDEIFPACGEAPEAYSW